jgi:hypothetical protein
VSCMLRWVVLMLLFLRVAFAVVFVAVCVAARL